MDASALNLVEGLPWEGTFNCRCVFVLFSALTANAFPLMIGAVDTMRPEATRAVDWDPFDIV